MQRRNFVMLAGTTWLGFHAVDALPAGTKTPVSAAAFAGARRFVDTRFGRIAHIDQGRGDAVLLLHGLPLNSFQWRDVIALLAAERRCLAPDFLGLGHTEVAPGQAVGPLDQCAMVIEFLDAKGIQHVDVIASDSGGAVAQHLVTRHPERVRTLLLANCDTEIDYPVAVLQPVIELSKQGKFADEVVTAWVADKALFRSEDKGLGACYAARSQPSDEAIEQYLAPLLSSPAKKAGLHAYCLGLEANPLAGIEPALRKCRVPVRVVWGADDRLFSTRSPDYLGRTFGNSQGVRMLEGYRLFWPEERPDIVVEEARRLWGAT